MMTEREPEECCGMEMEDSSTLEKQLAEEKTKAEANLAGWQRAQADFSNYKRRCEQEKEDTVRYANSALILKVLAVLDDWERALTSVPPDLAEESWVGGIRLIERKLRTVLEANGVSSFESVGEPFDPNRHDAAGFAKGQDGIVAAELQKGYNFHDKVLRPARVMVGRSGDKEEE
jgi:molecular chaperone GrpE